MYWVCAKRTLHVSWYGKILSFFSSPWDVDCCVGFCFPNWHNWGWFRLLGGGVGLGLFPFSARHRALCSRLLCDFSLTACPLADFYSPEQSHRTDACGKCRREAAAGQLVLRNYRGCPVDRCICSCRQHQRSCRCTRPLLYRCHHGHPRHLSAVCIRFRTPMPCVAKKQTLLLQTTAFHPAFLL